MTENSCFSDVLARKVCWSLATSQKCKICHGSSTSVEIHRPNQQITKTFYQVAIRNFELQPYKITNRQMAQPQVPWYRVQYQSCLWVQLGGTGIDRHQLLQCLLRVHPGVPGVDFTRYHSIQGSRTTVQNPTRTEVTPNSVKSSRDFIILGYFQYLNRIVDNGFTSNFVLFWPTKFLQLNI